ncbi:MAG: universal stress protein [Sulfuritalea sp.]|nr:universal stress protein [Sulfuritalea sp.]
MPTMLRVSTAIAMPSEAVPPPTAVRHAKVRRLLIPVKSAKDAGHAVAYAIRRRAEGLGVAVCLLHVEESPTQWQALSANAEARAVKRRRADHVFAPAMRMLEGLDIEFAAYVRSGPIVFTILDAAEELACDEIVVAEPGKGVFGLLSRRVVPVLMARQRSARLVAVTNAGVAVA